MSIVGALLGGWLAFSTSRRNALLISGVGQVASFTLYVVVALGAGGIGLLWVATIAEGVLGTMATVALFALMMDASDPEHAGTDYTLLACVVLVVGMIANICGGGARRRVRLRDRVHDAARSSRCSAAWRWSGCWIAISSRRASRSRGARPSQPRAATPSQTSATGY